MEICGLNIKRRLETLAAAEWFILLFFGIAVGTVLFIYIWFTSFWWINVLYLTWMYFDWDSPEKGGHYSPWVLGLAKWRYALNYFPCRLEYAPGFELDPKRNYLFCCFPHGVIPSAVPLSTVVHTGPFYQKYPNFIVKCTILNLTFLAPFYREYILATAAISCSRKSLEFFLNKPEGGHIALLYPGGAEEAFHFDEYVFVIKNRKGFVKLALQTGTPLVPVVTFGSNELYTQIKNPLIRKLQNYIKHVTGFAPVVINGRGFFQESFGLVPRRREMTTVLGAPIDVAKEENPTQEQIDELHQRFVEAVSKLFEEEKRKYLKNPDDIRAMLI